MSDFKKQIFAIQATLEFEEIALQLFRYQAKYNTVYNRFIRHLCINPDAVLSIEAIPFLPVELFKTHTVRTHEKAVTHTFTSSGTTGQNTSSHYVADINIYIESFTRCFNLFYGSITDYVVLALLPSYLERNNSSLVFMAQHLIAQSAHSESGFYLYNLSELYEQLRSLEKKGQKVLLLGVTYALLDFAEQYPLPLKHTTIMETGGMKGRRKELLREEVHELLATTFKTNLIHSEYGMTELLSQAYSTGDGVFTCPPWMKILIRDINDPMNMLPIGVSGGINIIDLANIDSCAFIATKDIGKMDDANHFKVLGRFDDSDIRGCNLMVG